MNKENERIQSHIPFQWVCFWCTSLCFWPTHYLILAFVKWLLKIYIFIRLICWTENCDSFIDARGREKTLSSVSVVKTEPSTWKVRVLQCVCVCAREKEWGGSLRTQHSKAIQFNIFRMRWMENYMKNHFIDQKVKRMKTRIFLSIFFNYSSMQWPYFCCALFNSAKRKKNLHRKLLS